MALVLAAPAAPAPAWVLWRSGSTFTLRASFIGARHTGTSGIGFQPIFSPGRFIVGLSNTFEDIYLQRSLPLGPTEPRHYRTFGAGLFGGVYLTRFLALVGGVDFLQATPQGDDESEVDRDADLLRLYAAVRLTTGHSGAFGGGAVAVQHRRPFPLRTYNVDIGYAHTFATRSIPSGGGMMFTLSAPMLAF